MNNNQFPHSGCWLLRLVCFTLVFHLPFFTGHGLAAQESKRVLFVGNSYTEVNNLPQMVADVAASMGDYLTFSSYTPGGCTFQQHCSNQSMALIRQGGWDAVVLQEQSQYPSFPDGQVQAEVFPYAKRLVDSIYAHGWCTEPMFYMTWGRKNGDAYNAQFFPPLATYEGMDSLLYVRYLRMAADNDASVCPVGRVWRYLHDSHSGIELYQADDSHPTVAGTYAAACSFYTMLFHGNPTDITYCPETLTPTVAQTIRQAVRMVVYDSLPSWQRRRPDMQVVEADTPQYMECSFVLLLDDSDTVFCDWGDGNDTLYTSTPQLSVSHTYTDTGYYIITLTATRHCLDTVVELTFQVGQEGILDLQPPASNLHVYPNPATDQIYVGRCADLVLYTIDGRQLCSRRHSDSMSLDGLAGGLYLLSVDGRMYRIIKE